MSTIDEFIQKHKKTHAMFAQVVYEGLCDDEPDISKHEALLISVIDQCEFNNLVTTRTTHKDYVIVLFSDGSCLVSRDKHHHILLKAENLSFAEKNLDQLISEVKRREAHHATK